MKWGQLPGDDRDLLFWVLWFAIGHCSDFGLDKLLKRLSTLSEGLVGDPGWEFEYVKDEMDEDYYSFSAEYEFSGIEPHQRNYSVAIVREAIKESLLALANKNQAKVFEVKELIRKYKFDYV